MVPSIGRGKDVVDLIRLCDYRIIYYIDVESLYLCHSSFLPGYSPLQPYFSSPPPTPPLYFPFIPATHLALSWSNGEFPLDFPLTSFRMIECGVVEL